MCFSQHIINNIIVVCFCIMLSNYGMIINIINYYLDLRRYFCNRFYDLTITKVFCIYITFNCYNILSFIICLNKYGYFYPFFIFYIHSVTDLPILILSQKLKKSTLYFFIFIKFYYFLSNWLFNNKSIIFIIILLFM